MGEKTLSRKLAIFILIIATIFWGSTFAFTKDLTQYYSPYWLLFIRFGIASALLFALYPKLIIKTSIELLRHDESGVIKRLILIAVVNFLAIFSQTMGLTEISVSNSGFITSLSLLFIPFIEVFFRHKKVTRNMQVAVAIALCGVYFMAYGLSLPQVLILGDLYTFFCAVMYAVMIVLVDSLAKRTNTATIMFYLFFTSSLFAGIGLLFVPSSISPEATSFPALFNMFFLIVLGSLVPYIFMGMGQRVVDAQTAGLIYILEPVFAMSIAILFFAEQPRLNGFIGGVLVLLAQYVGLRKVNSNTRCEA